MTDTEPTVEPDELDIEPEPDDGDEPDEPDDDFEDIDNQLVIAHEHEPDRRRRRRQEAARERIAELMAMKQLTALGIAARSRRQATHPDPRIANLPWVGDIAEHHGIQL